MTQNRDENRTPSFLLVEDDEVDREAMLRGFSTAKVPGTLTVANDGLEALDILREWQNPRRKNGPCVVIADLNMPRMNGLEFLQELRADPKLSQYIVFVCTTSCSESDRRDAFKFNVAGYVSKSRIGTQWDRFARLLHEYIALTEAPA